MPLELHLNYGQKIRKIYDVNLQGTRNTIEAAAEAGVKKMVYVSSIAALDYTRLPTKESYGYNPDRGICIIILKMTVKSWLLNWLQSLE
jgi:nucleoside-diphosphate-sugar epimerase